MSALEGYPLLGHLPAWTGEPLELLERHAESGQPFWLRLGRPAIVGFHPEWNRWVLGNLEALRSRTSFSRWIQHLNGGVITLDAPQHRPRRKELAEPFGATWLQRWRARLSTAVRVPPGRFEALRWSDTTTLELLNQVFFSGDFDPELLGRYLAPLRRPFPVPMVPRPALLRSVQRELARLTELRRGQPGRDLLSSLGGLEGRSEELRIALGAAHDTTSHALAWTIWHLALHPEWNTEEGRRLAFRETLRLYPPGWMGSRVAARPLTFGALQIPRGSLVLYSPYLCHRSQVWESPLSFLPGRFRGRIPAWGYLPFGGGERTCLGMHLAELIVGVALEALGGLRASWGNPSPVAGVTLGPKGPLWVERAAMAGRARWQQASQTP